MTASGGNAEADFRQEEENVDDFGAEEGAMARIGHQMIYRRKMDLAVYTLVGEE
jgi:hypothetical protein